QQRGLPGSAPRPGGPGPGGRPARPEPHRACRPDPTRSRNRTMSPHPTPTHPHRARSVVLGVLLPALLVAGAALLTTTWLPRLPDPAVLHWSLHGPARTGPFAELVTVVVALAATTWLLFTTLVLAAGRTEGARRVLVGSAVLLGATYAAVLLEIGRAHV